MARDIRFTERFETEWNGRGDIDDVRGVEQIHQSIVISVVENVGLAAPTFSPTTIEEHRGDIEAAVERNEFTQSPINVEVETQDPEAQSITYTISTARVSVPITFSDT